MREFIERHPLITLYAISSVMIAFGICLHASSFIPFFIIMGISGLLAAVLLAIDEL